MPSTVVGGLSGGVLLVSGWPYSGGPGQMPYAGVQLRADRANSGNLYVGLSGGVTITSGQIVGSGGAASGMLDGMQLGPGDAYFVPRLGSVSQGSGKLTIYVAPDTACSGQARIYFEIL